jgi:Large polyvalent protein-associated domain 7
MNGITEGQARQVAPDRHGEVHYIPTSAASDLALEISDASQLKDAGQGEALRARSSIESRTDLRLATTNEAMRADPNRRSDAVLVEQDTARRWADLDATDFGRIRSEARREHALEAVAGHLRASPQYADALKKRSPALADAARALNEARAKAEQQAAAQASESQRKTALAARDSVRQSTIDAAALASVAIVRSRETARVVDQLLRSPDTATQQLRDAQQSLKAPPLDGRVTAPDDPDTAAAVQRAIKRPVADEELSRAMLTRYIVSHEKRGFLDRGATEFTHRSGQQQGTLAFVDTGKSISTQLEDKSTIRAMVEVAAAKNWKEITVSGTDDFKRSAWLEANLDGMLVRGYVPREADKVLLAELQARDQPANALVLTQQARAPDSPQPSAPAENRRKHIDGDALSEEQKTVMDNSRAFLNSKDMGFGPEVTEATVRALESRLRGERLYVGEVIDHGHAPYKHDTKNDPSYFVVLKTPAGEQVIWGKGLAQAMEDQKIGSDIVLQNIGKKDVTVLERMRDAQGNEVGTRPKESQLNAWKAEALSRYSEKGRAGLEPSRTTAKQPAYKVYDPKAERTPAPSRLKNPVQDKETRREQQNAQRGNRDR